MGKKNIWPAFLIGASLIASFLINAILLPDFPIHSIFVIPILMAVYWLSPRATAVVAALSVGVHVLVDYLQHVPFPIASGYALAFLIVALSIVYLSYRLSAEKKDNAQHKGQLEFQRARWEAAVDSMIDPVVVSDAKGQIVYMNSVYWRNIGRHLAPGTAAEDHPKVLESSRAEGTSIDSQNRPLQLAALKGEEVREVELLHFPGESNEFRAIWNASPIRDSGGNVTGAVGVGRDVAKSKKAEKALRDSEERYRTLLQSIPQKVFYKDQDSVYLAVNTSYAQDFHLTPADFVGKTDFDFYEPDLAEKYRRDDQHTLASGAAEEYEERYARGGEQRFVHTLKAPVRNDEGAVVGVLGIFWDITERKLAEEERERLLRQVAELAAISQRRAAELQGIIDHMVEAVLVADPDGYLKLANQPGLDIIGAKGPGDLKQTLPEIANLLHLRFPNGTAVDPEEMALARALKGEVVVGSEQVATDQGTGRDIYLRTSAAPIRDDRGEIVGAVAVIWDVTELTELDRLKGQFIDVAAHELKTPVAIMKGSAQLLLRSLTELPVTQRKLLEGMNRNADRIDRVVNDLLNMSALQQGQIQLVEERFDLADLIEEAVGRMALTTTKHEIQVLHAEPSIILADRGRSEQVLINLLDNAVRYSPKGGKIELTMQVDRGEP